VNHDMHDGGYVWLEEEDRVNEAIVLVGDIPCPMSGPTQNERHHEKSTGTQVVQKCLPHRDEPEGKRAQIMFDAGNSQPGVFKGAKGGSVNSANFTTTYPGGRSLRPARSGEHARQKPAEA
jgi:hypothetical protein